MHLPTRRRNRRKLVLILLLSVLSLLAVLYFGAAWYFSGVLKDRALEVMENEFKYNLTASAFDQGLVRLENGPDRGAWRRPGKWGLSWDGGSGMIGDIVEDGGDYLVRQFTIGDGDPRPPPQPSCRAASTRTILSSHLASSTKMFNTRPRWDLRTHGGLKENTTHGPYLSTDIAELRETACPHCLCCMTSVPGLIHHLP